MNDLLKPQFVNWKGKQKKTETISFIKDVNTE